MQWDYQYKVRKLCIPSVLRSLYFSLFNSHLSYGLVVWGNASNKDIDKIKSLQRRAIRAITPAPHVLDIEHVLSDLKILNFEDQYKLQLSSLMWDYDHDIIPSALKVLFKRTNSLHNYKTRGAAKGNLHYTKVNTTMYGIYSFKYQGTQILNYLKTLGIYQDTQFKKKILKDLKSYFLLEYIQ